MVGRKDAGHEAEGRSQRQGWLAGLNELAATINRHRETRPLVEATLASLTAVLAADGSQCVLLGSNERAPLLISHRLEKEFLAQQETADDIPDECLLQTAFELEAPVYTVGGEGTCPWQQLAHAAGYQTLLAIPLRGQAQWLGACIFYYRAEHTLVDEELQLLMIAGRQLGTALERAQLWEAERSQRKHIEAVQRAGASVNRSLNLQEVLDSILTELAHVVAYDSASIILREERGLLIAAVRGLPDFREGQIIAEQNELSATIARTRRPLILEDAQRDPRFGRWLNTDYVRGWMGIPLLVQDKYVGHLTVDSRQKGAYTAADAARALSFAQQAAIAVTNARLHQDVQAQLAALQQTQERLLQSEKLAAIGQLVSGVAHELNNPLGAIQLHGELVQEKLGKTGSEIHNALQQILTQVQRAHNIVETLLDFARQRTPVRQAVVVNELVTNTVELMGYELRTHNVALELALVPEMPPIPADAQQLQQVLVNLINNAYQAMNQTERAQLRIGTEVVGEHPAAEIVITVSDRGPGIPEGELAHIFEPFYTTREPGTGTGLGLSVCHGIVSEHGGRIWAGNRPGGGATFSVSLPVEQEVPPAVMERTSPARSLDRARILIADDEDSLRLAMEDILMLVGCEVEVVADGGAGLAAVAAAHPAAPFDLVLCDVRMPGLDGPAFYRQLVEAYPHYRNRVLFITGDRLNADTRRFLNAEEVPWLAKPFDMETLMHRVGETLEKAGVQEANS